LLASLFILAALSGCGSDELSGEIPEQNAIDLKAALAAVRAEIEANPPNCDTAASQADEFVDAVNLLPADVGEVKTELQGAGDNLRTLVDAECPTTDTSQTTQTTTPTTTTTTSSTTEPTTTDTTTTDTTSTTSTTTDEPPSPGDGGGGGPSGDGGGTDGGTGGTGGGGTGDETGD
jgi:hypothetical protein